MTRLTAPGGWTVEVVNLDGRQWYEVKRHGYLIGGRQGRRHGLVATIAEVQAIMGEAFGKLR
jgi:hypothetical protein